MKYGKEVLEAISKPVIKINSEIEALEKEKVGIKAKLEKNKDSFSMDVIKNNRSLESDLSMIERAIVKANKHKQSLINDKGEANYLLVKQAINKVKATEKLAKQKENDLIDKKINEIRELVKEIKAYDKEVIGGLNELVREVKPYMSNEKIARFGALETYSNELENSVQASSYTPTTVVNLVKEYDYQIKGLIPQY